MIQIIKKNVEIVTIKQDPYVQEDRGKYEHDKRQGRQVKDPDQTSGNEKEIHGRKNTLDEINSRLNTA